MNPAQQRLRLLYPQQAYKTRVSRGCMRNLTTLKAKIFLGNTAHYQTGSSSFERDSACVADNIYCIKAVLLGRDFKPLIFGNS